MSIERIGGVEIDTEETTIQDLIDDDRISIARFAEFFDGNFGCGTLEEGRISVKTRSEIERSIRRSIGEWTDADLNTAQTLKESEAEFFYISGNPDLGAQPIEDKETLACCMGLLGAMINGETLQDLAQAAKTAEELLKEMEATALEQMMACGIERAKDQEIAASTKDMEVER